METNFNNESVPGNFVQCWHEECVQAQKCTRRLVAVHHTSQQPVIHMVNPACIPQDTGACPYFHAVRKVRVAWGTRHMFDNLPHQKAIALKSQVMGYFGKTAYYRIYRKEKGIMPEQQDVIRLLFRKNGFPEGPVYEYCTDEYLWK